MNPQRRLYCSCSRRSLGLRASNLELWEGLSYQVCEDCIVKVQRRGDVSALIPFETEMKIQKALQAREGGQTEVETPVGFVDILGKIKILAR